MESARSALQGERGKGRGIDAVVDVNCYPGVLNPVPQSDAI